MQPKTGITLISLIITIVVLIILAGVTLNVTLGENGILNKSKNAVDKYQETAKKEQAELDKIYGELEGYYEAKTQTETIDGLTQSELQTAKESGTRILHQNPVIPKGYSAVQTDNASWITETANGKTYVKGWNNGLVIKDSKGNEWVWVPIENPDEMYTTGSYTINRATGTKYSKLYDFSTAGRTEKTGTEPTGTDCREPGYLSYYEGEFDYWGVVDTGAQFHSSTEMTQYFVTDYEAMMQSVIDNGGFYIGRYELSGTVNSPAVVKGKMPLTDTNWYRLHLACRYLGTESATSTMIWGTQWDATLEWLVDSGAKTYAELMDSSNWGNYINVTFEYTDESGATQTKAEDTGTKIPTGATERNQTNNIYDLAGNVHDWTQEAKDGYRAYRMCRGGAYWYYSGDEAPVSWRGSGEPNSVTR